MSLMDYVVRASSYAYKGGTEKRQINKLLEMVPNIPEDRLFEELSLHLARQVGRKRFNKNAAREIINGLLFLKQNNMFTKKKVAEFLGLVKWAYEALKDSNVKMDWREIRGLNYIGFLKKLRLVA